MPTQMPTQFHAYTDGSITILGTCLADAILAYERENPAFRISSTTATWRQLGDGELRTVTNGDSRYRATIRECIQVHLTRRPNDFSRLLFAKEAS